MAREATLSEDAVLHHAAADIADTLRQDRLPHVTTVNVRGKSVHINTDVDREVINEAELEDAVEQHLGDYPFTVSEWWKRDTLVVEPYWIMSSALSQEQRDRYDEFITEHEDGYTR